MVAEVKCKRAVTSSRFKTRRLTRQFREVSGVLLVPGGVRAKTGCENTSQLKASIIQASARRAARERRRRGAGLITAKTDGEASAVGPASSGGAVLKRRSKGGRSRFPVPNDVPEHQAKERCPGRGRGGGADRGASLQPPSDECNANPAADSVDRPCTIQQYSSTAQMYDRE